MKKLLLLSLILISFIACKKDRHDHTHYGQESQLGSGTIQTFARTSHDGRLEEMGLIFSNAIFTSLPVSFTELMLSLPAQVLQSTPFKHVSFSWLPVGHPPAVFSVPHFDIHFFMISHDEQMKIPPPDASNQNLFAAPPDGYLPEDYTVAFASVPMMGRHWIDKTSPVQPVNPTEPFMHEFMWGTYNKKVAFVEPMIAKAFLDALRSGNATEVHKSIKQPKLFDPSGTYYPTQYNLYKDTEGNVYVSLSEFVAR